MTSEAETNNTRKKTRVYKRHKILISVYVPYNIYEFIMKMVEVEDFSISRAAAELIEEGYMQRKKREFVRGRVNKPHLRAVEKRTENDDNEKTKSEDAQEWV